MQRLPDRPGATGEPLSPEARRRMMRAAFLRPRSLLVVAIGGVFFAITSAWWAVPLTLATYTALVFLDTRYPPFRDSIPEKREGRPETRYESLREKDISPERRARWLPRGKTRREVEAALEVNRRTLFAIEEAGEVARAVLDDAVPKLHHVSDRLVDVAEKRERVAGAIRDLKTHTGTEHHEVREANLTELENELRAADAEISGIFEKLLALRARVVRVSVESGGAAQNAAAKLNADLDEMNLRLDALRSTMSPPESPDK